MTPRDIFDTPIEDMVAAIVGIVGPIIIVYAVLQIAMFVWIWRKM